MFRTRRVTVATEPGEAGRRMSVLLASVAEQRDKAAFMELYDHFAPRVQAYLLRLALEPAQAEELTQETMLTVWRKAPQYDPAKASAATWIFTIARNRRIDAVRRERHFEADPTDPLLLPDEEPSADQRLEATQREALVRSALKALPSDQVEIVSMWYFDDKPHSAIADELGIPLGTVKSRLRRAFQTLRDVLGDAR